MFCNSTRNRVFTLVTCHESALDLLKAKAPHPRVLPGACWPYNPSHTDATRGWMTAQLHSERFAFHGPVPYELFQHTFFNVAGATQIFKQPPRHSWDSRCAPMRLTLLSVASAAHPRGTSSESPYFFIMGFGNRFHSSFPTVSSFVWTPCWHWTLPFFECVSSARHFRKYFSSYFTRFSRLFVTTRPTSRFTHVRQHADCWPPEVFCSLRHTAYNLSPQPPRAYKSA